jgi:hypothetical protein
MVGHFLAKENREIEGPRVPVHFHGFNLGSGKDSKWDELLKIS